MTEQKVVLCVDDEVEIIELLAEELVHRNFKVLKAYSGNDGLELFKNNKIDCVISDIRMPNGSGIQLLGNIRKINNDVPVYLITGYSDHSDKDIADLNVTAIVFKPFDIDEMVEMVVNILA